MTECTKMYPQNNFGTELTQNFIKYGYKEINKSEEEEEHRCGAMEYLQYLNDKHTKIQ